MCVCVCVQGIQRRRPSEAQSAILRRHLLELTQSFIIPLVRPRTRTRTPPPARANPAAAPPGALRGQPDAPAEIGDPVEGSRKRTVRCGPAADL